MYGQYYLTEINVIDAYQTRKNFWFKNNFKILYFRMKNQFLVTTPKINTRDFVEGLDF